MATPPLEASVKLEFTCSICREIFVDPCTTECGHTFCEKCIKDWIKDPNKTCPECRRLVTKSKIKPGLNRRSSSAAIGFIRSLSESSGSDHDLASSYGSPPAGASSYGSLFSGHRRTLTRQPSAPPTEDDVTFADQLPCQAAELCLPRLTFKCGDVYQTRALPHGITTIEKRLAFIYRDEIKRLHEGMSEVKWSGDLNVIAMSEVKDVAKMCHEDGRTSYIVCCSDSDYGLMQFNATGKFQYRVNDKLLAFCSVSCEKENLVALNHMDGKVNIYSYRHDCYEKGNKPWEGKAFKVAPGCTERDCVLAYDGCVYVLSTSARKLYQYNMGGTPHNKFPLGPSACDIAKPKLRLLLGRYIVLVNWGDHMQVLDTDSGRLVDLPIGGASIVQPLDLASCGNKVWITCPSNRKSVDVMQLTETW